MDNIIICNNKIYLIVYEENEVKSYEIKNKEKQEVKLPILNVMNEKYTDFNVYEEVNSFFDLEEILSSNPNLTDEEVLICIRTIDKIIPNGCHTLFYNNLKTLKIINEPITTGEVAFYNAKENTIKLSSNFAELINNSLRKEKLSEEELRYYRWATLFHELLHAASSYYDKEQNVTHTGFSKISPNSKKAYGDVYFNEGVTDAITQLAFPDILKNSGYLEEIAISSYISNLVREDIFKYYFMASGMQELKSKLYDLYPDAEEIDKLFLDIQANHLVRSEIVRLKYNTQISFLRNIGLTLIKLTEGKIKQEIASGKYKTKEEVLNYIKGLESNLIRKANINVFDDPKYYIGLEEIDESLEELKSKVFVESLSN